MSDKMREALKFARESIWSGCDAISALVKIDTALAQPQNDAEAVTIKPLHWSDSMVFGTRKWRGSGPLGEYSSFSGNDIPAERIEENKARIQADYEKQIRSAIVTAPPSPERMREALDLYRGMSDKPVYSGPNVANIIETICALRAGDNHASDLCQQCRKRKADRIFLDNTCTFHICGDCWSTNRDERDNHASEPIIGGTALCGHGVMAAICEKCNHASDEINPVLGAEPLTCRSDHGREAIGRTAGANPATGTNRASVPAVCGCDIYTGCNHASDGKESEGGGESGPASSGTGGQAPCIERTTPATMPAQAGVAPGPSDPTPAQERREEIARIVRHFIGTEVQQKDYGFRYSNEAFDKMVDALALPPAPKGEPSQEWNEAIEAGAQAIKKLTTDTITNKRCRPSYSDVAKACIEAALRREPEGER